MSPPPPPEEIARLMRFIAEKSKGVKPPMNLQQLCRQFKQETGSVAAESCVKGRIHSNRRRIHEMDEFDMDTKVEMIFALSAPIDFEFLIELKKHAEVDVDDAQRIIRFKKTGGGLELNGRHSLSTMQQNTRYREMLQFLVEKAETLMAPITDTLFVKEFRTKTGDKSGQWSLMSLYTKIRNTIFRLSGIDMHTKVKMMFISNAKLSEEILKQLRSDAYVEADMKGRITKYEAYDGSLMLGTNRGRHEMLKAAKTDITRQSLEAISKGTKRARKELEFEYDVDPPSYENDMNHVEKKPEKLLGTIVNIKRQYPSTSNLEYHYEDYYPPTNEEDPEHIPIEKKPDNLLDVKTEMPSTSIGGNHFSYYYDPPIPEEKKQESLIELETEVPKKPSNLIYQYEENLEHILIEPKPEIIC